MKSSPFGPKVEDAIPRDGVPKDWSKPDIADAIDDYELSIASRYAAQQAFNAAGIGSATERLAHARRTSQEEGFLASWLPGFTPQSIGEPKMIRQPIEYLLKNSETEPEAFDQLVDEYREGRNPGELLQLIGSSDNNLVRIGAWILSEIRASNYDTSEFRSRLIKLTEHQEPAIRLHSLNALFPLLDHGDPVAVKLIATLQSDTNDGVRMMADAAAAKLVVSR